MRSDTRPPHGEKRVSYFLSIGFVNPVNDAAGALITSRPAPPRSIERHVERDEQSHYHTHTGPLKETAKG